MEAKRPPSVDASKDISTTNELDDVSSPTDTALEMMKKKRLHQKMAKEQPKPTGGITLNESDIGASP